MGLNANKKKVGWWLACKAWLIWLLTRLLLMTVRVTVMHSERLERVQQPGKPLLYAFWHGRQMTLFKAKPEKRIAVMTSLSQDGQMQTKICQFFGLTVVRGSSSRGGLRGLLAMRSCLGRGLSVGVAVDGPKGPAYQAKPGILMLAKYCQTAVIPITVGLSRKWVLSRAWDRFVIPKPFSRATVGYGEPLIVPEQLDSSQLQALTEELSKRLNLLTQEVDSISVTG